MIVLGLDLARQTGWAAGAPCQPPAYGTIRLEGGLSDGARFMQLGRRIVELIDRFGVREIVIEAPFVGRQSTASALMPLFGYRATAMIAAASKGIDMAAPVTPATVRKHFIGHGGLKRAAAKPAVIDKCRWRGWSPANEDEADALALWDYRCAVRDPQHLAMGMRKGNG